MMRTILVDSYTDSAPAQYSTTATARTFLPFHTITTPELTVSIAWVKDAAPVHVHSAIVREETRMVLR